MASTHFLLFLACHPLLSFHFSNTSFLSLLTDSYSPYSHLSHPSYHQSYPPQPGPPPPPPNYDPYSNYPQEHSRSSSMSLPVSTGGRKRENSRDSKGKRKGGGGGKQPLVKREVSETLANMRKREGAAPMGRGKDVVNLTPASSKGRARLASGSQNGNGNRKKGKDGNSLANSISVDDIETPRKFHDVNMKGKAEAREYSLFPHPLSLSLLIPFSRQSLILSSFLILFFQQLKFLLLQLQQTELGLGMETKRLCH